ncbi:hypothetical protein TWF281_000688 [Arthrobotrys megalospora]
MLARLLLLPVADGAGVWVFGRASRRGTGHGTVGGNRRDGLDDDVVVGGGPWEEVVEGEVGCSCLGDQVWHHYSQLLLQRKQAVSRKGRPLAVAEGEEENPGQLSNGSWRMTKGRERLRWVREPPLFEFKRMMVWEVRGGRIGINDLECFPVLELERRVGHLGSDGAIC